MGNVYEGFVRQMGGKYMANAVIGASAGAGIGAAADSDNRDAGLLMGIVAGGALGAGAAKMMLGSAQKGVAKAAEAATAKAGGAQLHETAAAAASAPIHAPTADTINRESVAYRAGAYRQNNGGPQKSWAQTAGFAFQTASLERDVEKHVQWARQQTQRRARAATSAQNAAAGASGPFGNTMYRVKNFGNKFVNGTMFDAARGTPAATAASPFRGGASYRQGAPTARATRAAGNAQANRWLENANNYGNPVAGARAATRR